MKLKKILIIFNFLLLINLISQCLCIHDLSKGDNTDSLKKIRKELEKKKKHKIILGSVLGGLALALSIGLGVAFSGKKKHRNKSYGDSPDNEFSKKGEFSKEDDFSKESESKERNDNSYFNLTPNKKPYDYYNFNYDVETGLNEFFDESLAGDIPNKTYEEMRSFTFNELQNHFNYYGPQYEHLIPYEYESIGVSIRDILLQNGIKASDEQVKQLEKEALSLYLNTGNFDPIGEFLYIDETRLF
ncbi:early transcribed membrane protein [Plasmodium gallinaceum]|uniref:Early transcribed membrane protein n=1 Tax=Plasmodium gallinaceum TaxID=5849 RepID=A0A1J1GX83_PLAGA|nr:early transcribed membrane protein [Plasmodium gallinaceum]CRG97179.1 early transcribed membrane protein [Plasmodium gallinaceum]